MAMKNSSSYAVVWPRSAKAVEVKPLAKRLDTLQGKTVAFLWDALFRGDEVWPMLKEELGKRYADLKFIDHTAFGSTHGGEEHKVLAELLPARHHLSSWQDAFAASQCSCAGRISSSAMLRSLVWGER